MDSHVHDPVIHERIVSEASEVHPGRFFGHLIRNVFLGLFRALGFLIGGFWFVIVYGCLAAKYGFYQGAKIPLPSPKKPSIPQ